MMGLASAAQVRGPMIPSRTDRVVDIGCGTGSATRAAGRVSIEGAALGVDLSAAMLHQAARRAQEEGLTNIRFEHGDAQGTASRPARAMSP